MRAGKITYWNNTTFKHAAVGLSRVDMSTGASTSGCAAALLGAPVPQRELTDG